MFTLAGQTVSVLEMAAFVSGLASVWLARSLHVANWPAGIVSVLCFAWLFVEAKLYADAALQGVFVVLCTYGWWAWTRADRAAGGGLRIEHPGATTLAAGFVAAACGMAACAFVLMAWSDSPAPWPDAAVLSFSLLATWAQARGWIASWWIWIGVDLVSVPLYWSRALPLTAVLYVLFLLLCFAGLRHWARVAREQAVA